MTISGIWGVFLSYFLAPFGIGCAILAVVEWIDERRHTH